MSAVLGNLGELVEQPQLLTTDPTCGSSVGVRLLVSPLPCLPQLLGDPGIIWFNSQKNPPKSLTWKHHENVKDDQVSA